jgi:site-specific recombinase XerD
MATVKPVVRVADASAVTGKVKIKIRVCHKNGTVYLPTNFYTLPEQFNKKEGNVNERHPEYIVIYPKIIDIVKNVKIKIYELGIRIDYMDIKELEYYLKYSEMKSMDFKVFIKDHISKLQEEEKIKTAETYQYTHDSVSRFYPGKLPFEAINLQWLHNYEYYLKKRKLRINTISIHMRNIRAIYNKAIDYDIVKLDNYPFRRYKIKKEKTIKRNLSIEDLKTIIQAKGLNKYEEIARDVFILSFGLIGINTIDLFNLKHSDLLYGRIKYRRRKTGRIYDIKVTDQAKNIIKKYRGDDEYLLNFHSKYSNHKNLSILVNYKLKDIAEKVNISRHDLTMYFARHTWATIASELDVPEKVISHALGHGNNTVTDIYINFDVQKIDRANEAIHNYVYGRKKLKIEYKKAE